MKRPHLLSKRPVRGLSCATLIGAAVASIGLTHGAIHEAESSARRFLSLDGTWDFQPEGAPPEAWKPVRVPSSFEEHEGPNFDGTGWYRRQIELPEIPAGCRVLLHFQAAATETEVWWNGERLGSHLGGWTPFRFDITERIQPAATARSHELRVRVDEKVGHYTQGFLPVIAPHFGGLWQSVGLWIVPETFLDDLRLWAEGRPDQKALRLHLPVGGSPLTSTPALRVRARWLGQTDWHELELTELSFTSNALTAHVSVPQVRWWSPETPQLLELELTLGTERPDQVRTRAAFRKVEAWGPQLRLNGRALSVRGLLHWGYSPPLCAPRAGEEAWRRELEFARQCGFNLLKFCLWVPPRQYLELADEMGLLVWMEYPTWHAPLKRQNLPLLEQEFLEFYHYDRVHPSVILRSLTCETGPGADLEVLQRLYDLAHATAPGGLVVDDSSWIGWQRVHDFYDDHPYGNNHTWKATLHRLQTHIRQHGLKPLLLGEAMAADTWPDLKSLQDRMGSRRTWWTPAGWDSMLQWQERLARLTGYRPESLTEDSLSYAFLMRKFQAEVFRRELPYSGYVMSVLRDIPKASMGLLDYLDRPKWSAEMQSFQADTICLLETPNDRRSFHSGELFQGKILVSHFGAEPLRDGRLLVALADAPGIPLHRLEHTEARQNPGTLAIWTHIDWPLPSVDQPTPLRLEARLRHRNGEVTNVWPLWLVPRPRPLSQPSIVRHSSLATHPLHPELCVSPSFSPATPKSSLVIASRLDPDLAAWLEAGGRVLLLPDGGLHSFRLQDHWFLRGAPVVVPTPWTRTVPRLFWIELQHFDLAGPVVPELEPLEAFDPVLLLWDTHDRDHVVTHGLVFGTQVGKGSLWISTLRHHGPGNAAGRWLLELWARELPSAPPPRRRLPDTLWKAVRIGLASQQRSLAASPWRFRPESPDRLDDPSGPAPNASALAQWPQIAIGQWWETQGYPSLDGAAWYYCELSIPPAWAGREIYLTFTGVDDAYELYVNGQPAGAGGDVSRRNDALNEIRSHRITPYLQGQSRALVAVRVVDWHGAGGIFRPVYVGTAPLAELPPLLRWTD